MLSLNKWYKVKDHPTALRMVAQTMPTLVADKDGSMMLVRFEDDLMFPENVGGYEYEMEFNQKQIVAFCIPKSYKG